MTRQGSSGGAARILGLLLAGAGATGAARGQDGALRAVEVRPAAASEVRASGRTAPSWTAQVGARVAGRIVSWGVDASGRPLDVGAHVTKDQELFRVDASVSEAKAAAARAAHALAAARLADLKAGVRPERVAALEAAVAEIDAVIEEHRRDEDRFRRLVEEDRTMPAKRLEEVRTRRAAAEAQKAAAVARLAEARAGSTASELAVGEAAVAEAAAQVALAELDVRDAVVRAPFAGVVTRRVRTLGDYVNHAPFTEVLELASDREIEAELRLPEAFLRDLRPGETRVTLESPLLADRPTLVVDRTHGVVDPREGTFAFRVRIPEDRLGRLVPGAFVQATVELPAAGGAVAVPLAALAFEGDRAVVYRIADGSLHRVPVTVVERLTVDALVRGELAAGDRVAVGPKSALRHGAPAPAPPAADPPR